MPGKFKFDERPAGYNTNNNINNDYDNNNNNHHWISWPALSIRHFICRQPRKTNLITLYFHFLCQQQEKVQRGVGVCSWGESRRKDDARDFGEKNFKSFWSKQSLSALAYFA